MTTSGKSSAEFFHEDQVKSSPTYMQMLIRLWPFIRKQKAYATIVLVSMVLLALIGRILPTLIGKAIDDGIMKNNMTVVIYIAASFLLVEILRSAFQFILRYYYHKLGNRVLYHLREKVISHVQSLPIPFFDKNPTGRIVTRVTNDVAALGDVFTQGLISVITDMLSLILILVFMFSISVKLTLASLIFGPLLVITTIYLSRKIRAVLRQTKKKLARINAFVAENINGMKVLQLYNATERNSSRFMNLSRDYRDTQLKAVRLYALLWPTVNFFIAVTLTIALFYGGYLAAEQAVSVGTLIAFFIHIKDFFPPMRHILEKYQTFQNSLAGAERVFAILDEAPESLSGQKFKQDKIHGQIDIRNLSFRYGRELPFVLRDINLDIQPGESLAVVGRTGSGKSTLISLLQRMHDYEDGEILLDGFPLRTIARRHLRSRIGVVQQDNFIFRGTIESNISLNNRQVSKFMVEQAVRKAHCQELLLRHGGLQTRVEERGANLSVGERQLIAFARILAFNPDILILDEATANIDSHNEALIQKATEEVTRDRTSIIIAHRLSTILHCDRIVVLRDGRIVEMGPHSELLGKQGVYHQLYHSQFQGDQTELIQ